MKKHIELERRFYRIDEKATAFPEDVHLYGDSEYATDGWKFLLDRKRVVVLAEAGMGKSEEFRVQTAKAIESGKIAFNARIERLADGNFAYALEQGTEDAVAAWKNGEDVAYFFLDSVDEARLTYKRFTDALRTVASVIVGAEERARIFVSSRPSDWRWHEDIASIKEILPVRNAVASATDEQPPALSDEAMLWPLRRARERRSNNDDGGDEKKDNICVVRLLGLTPVKIENFARQRGVTDPKAFMQALEDADAMVLVARPQDLDGVIEIWEESQRIGTHVEALRASIKQRLRETNLDQATLRNLSDDQALQGARRVAAALTLGRATTVDVPDCKGAGEGSLDIGEILPSWSPKQQQSLLSRGIFDPATYGRVRFHHLEVQQLLTADWLLQLLEKGCPQRMIEGLLIADSHGFQVIRPSLRPVASWIGQRHEDTRKRLLTIAPEVLIENGDPSLIPIPARAALLKKFAERYRDRKDSGTSINIDNVKRLAHSDLSPTIEELWDEHPESNDVRELLLRLIWKGEIKENAPIAVSVLESENSGEYLRMLALRALSAAGSQEQRVESVALTVANAKEWGSRAVGEAIDVFYPSAMQNDQLAALLETVDEREGKRATGIGWKLGQIASRSTEPEVECMLHVVMPFVLREPHADHVKVSQRYKWLLDPLATICERLLPRGNGQPSDTLSEAVELIEQCQFWHSDVHVETKQLASILQDPHMTRHFFWRSVATLVQKLEREGKQIESYWQLRSVHKVWDLKETDFSWLVSDLKSPLPHHVRTAGLLAVLHVWDSFGRREEWMVATREAIQDNEVLQQILREHLNPPPRSVSEEESERQERNERSDREREERRRNADQSWLDFRNELRRQPSRLSRRESAERDTEFRDLWDLNKWLRLHVDNDSKYSIGNWELLASGFGQEVAEAARDRFRVYWKTIDCSENLLSDQITNGCIVALMGVAIEARTRGWPKSLSDEEVRRATRLAFKEMNGVPNWLADIFEHKSDVAAKTLRPLIARELQLEPDLPDPTRAIERLGYSPPNLKNRVASIILDELEQHDPSRPQTLRTALRLLLGWPGLDRARVSALARNRIQKNSNNVGLRSLWLAALLCVDADAGVPELERCLAVLPQNVGDDLVKDLLNTLYEHRDLTFGSSHADFLRAGRLVPFLTLVLGRVRPEDDNQHDEGSYTPDERDDAENARGMLLESFTNIPGRETVDSLLALRKEPEWQRYNERLLVWAERRAAKDGDLSPWVPSEVAEFECRYERPVRSGTDLYEIAIDQLGTLKYELENDDFSARDLLRQDGRKRADEQQVQNWFARELKNAAHHRYTVHREEEVIDENKPDIRLSSENADGPSSIEIKVADSWSLSQLESALEEQLVGKYMRDQYSRHGILLLTWHGKKPAWGQQKLNFLQLAQHLQKRAVDLRERTTAIDNLAVVAIDLTRDQKM